MFQLPIVQGKWPVLSALTDYIRSIVVTSHQINNIQFTQQPDNVILTAADQALYSDSETYLRADADGVTFRKSDDTPVVIADKSNVLIDGTEQLTNDLVFDVNECDFTVNKRFEIDTNGNKVLFEGDNNKIDIYTTEDYDNGLEAETEENQRVVKNRGSGNIIDFNGRRIFSGSRPTEISSPVNIPDPYVISQNGFSYEGFKLGSPANDCLFTDWWKAWGGLDIVGDGSILIPPVFNPFSGSLQRKVWTDDPSGRFMRLNTPFGGATGVDPDVHSRTSPITFATIATYTSSASAEISGITDADALKLKVGARVADAGINIPQGSSGTPKTTIISLIVHNGTNDNSIFLIDSETGAAISPVSATGNLTIDMSGNSGTSHQLDAMQRITGRTAAIRSASTVGNGVFSQGANGNTNATTGTVQAPHNDFDNADSVSPNVAKTNDDETRAISNQRQSYLIL